MKAGGFGIWKPSDFESTSEVTIQSLQETMTLFTTDRSRQLMKELGIDLYPEDRLLMNGIAIDPEVLIEGDGSLYLQYVPAKAILIKWMSKTLLTPAEPTLGAALENAGINLGSQDWLSSDLGYALWMPCMLRSGKPNRFTVEIDGNVLTGLSSATTVGEALLDLGISLQNLAHSIPADGEPVPEDRQIQIQRVNETVSIAIEEIPHESDYIEDPNTSLDQISVIEPGQDAIFATRERAQLENGECQRQNPPIHGKPAQPKDGLPGVGTKI